MDSGSNAFLAIDFETDRVPYFDKKGKSGLTYEGHPRLARVQILSHSDGLTTGHSKKPTLFHPPRRALVFHNASFDVPVGANAGIWGADIHRTQEVHCTWVMARILRNDRAAALKSLALSVLGEKEVVRFADAVESSESEFIRYAEKDALFTARLFPVLSKQLRESGQWELYSQIELPFLFVNLECQSIGFLTDGAMLSAQRSAYSNELVRIKAELADSSMNWNSHKQVQQKVYGEWNLALAYHKGRLSTSKKALKTLASDSRVTALLRLKDLSAKIRQLDTLARFIVPETGAIHPYINTLGADTGRCTSSCPNLQNIPKESSMRELFIARPGYRLVVLDFSQIEPRVLAHFLNPSAFSQLFLGSEDFYARLAREVFSSADSTVPARAIAKQVVLATFYGMGPRTLAENLKTTQTQAGSFLTRFFEVFPEIARFRDEQIALARRRGYAEGLFNRRRYIGGLDSDDPAQRFASERQVLNAIIQGSATTLFKLKLVQLRERLPASVKFLLHVHDEVVLEAPESEALSVYYSAKRCLEERVSDFSIPLQVEGGIGSSWAEAKNNPIYDNPKGGDEYGTAERTFPS